MSSIMRAIRRNAYRREHGGLYGFPGRPDPGQSEYSDRRRRYLKAKARRRLEKRRKAGNRAKGRNPVTGRRQ